MLVITGYQKCAKNQKKRKNVAPTNVHLLPGYAALDCRFQIHTSHKRTSCFRKSQMLASCIAPKMQMRQRETEKKYVNASQLPVAKSWRNGNRIAKIFEMRLLSCLVGRMDGESWRSGDIFVGTARRSVNLLSPSMRYCDDPMRGGVISGVRRMEGWAYPPCRWELVSLRLSNMVHLL